MAFFEMYAGYMNAECWCRNSRDFCPWDAHELAMDMQSDEPLKQFRQYCWHGWAVKGDGLCQSCQANLAVLNDGYRLYRPMFAFIEAQSAQIQALQDEIEMIKAKI